MFSLKNHAKSSSTILESFSTSLIQTYVPSHIYLFSSFYYHTFKVKVVKHLKDLPTELLVVRTPLVSGLVLVS